MTGVVGRGQNPEPADLARAAERWSEQELFWIVQHGIRMTGMPSFGRTHSDPEIWELVALVKRLPRMSVAEYRALLPVKAEADHGHAHSHSHGGERRHDRGHAP